MDLGDRKVIIGCCGGLLVLLALVVGGGWIFFKQAIEPHLPQTSPPESLEAEGPSVGADLMERTVFFEDDRVGAISDIAIGDLDDHPGTEIVCAGVKGAAVLDSSGEVISIIEYALDPQRNNARFMRILDVEDDGLCEFIGVEVLGYGGPVVLLDHRGKITWEADNTPPALAWGDVDGDGKLEFAGNTDDGIALVETDGSIAWQRKLDDYSGLNVEMADVNGDGRVEIVHPRVEIEPEQSVHTVGRDAAGEVVYEAEREGTLLSGGLFTSFRIIPWPTADAEPHILALESRKIVLFDLDGEDVFRGAAPGTNIYDRVWGTAFHAKPNRDVHLASIVLSTNFEATWLRLHSSEGELVFERGTRTHDPDAIWPGLAAWQPPGEDHEVLLVGGDGKVWQYEMQPEASSAL
jgi:hypothetical protein